MNGPCFLFRSIITLMVNRTTAGNYHLCEKDERQQLVVRRVGRSDTDLREELLKHTEDQTRLLFFFEYAAGPEEAYRRECLDYHEFRGTLFVQKHPRPPEGSDLRCPVEGCEYGEGKMPQR